MYPWLYIILPIKKLGNWGMETLDNLSKKEYPFESDLSHSSAQVLRIYNL